MECIAPIIGDSELMSKEERIYLAKLMPQKLEFHTWLLAFSTSNDGFSLKNMMRKLSERSSVTASLLLILQDMRNHIFGAFMSSVPSISEHFQGI